MNADKLRENYNEYIKRLREIQKEKLGIIELNDESRNYEKTDNSAEVSQIIEHIKKIINTCTERKKTLIEQNPYEKQEEYFEQIEKLQGKINELNELSEFGFLTEKDKEEIDAIYEQIRNLKIENNKQKQAIEEIDKLGNLINDISKVNLYNLGLDGYIDYKCPYCSKEMELEKNDLVCHDCDINFPFFEYDTCCDIVEKTQKKIDIERTHPQLSEESYHFYNQNNLEIIFDEKIKMWIVISDQVKSELKNSDEPLNMIINKKLPYFKIFITKEDCEKFIKKNFKEIKKSDSQPIPNEETKKNAENHINEYPIEKKIQKSFYNFFSHDKLEIIRDEKSKKYIVIPRDEIENMGNIDEIISMIMNSVIPYFETFETMEAAASFINKNFSKKEQQQEEKINIECPYCNNTFSQDRGIDVICPSCGVEMSYPQYNKLFAEQDKQKVARNIMNIYKEKVIPKKDYVKYKKSEIYYEKNEIFKVWFVKIKEEIENTNEEEERFFAVFSTKEECQEFIRANFEKQKKKVESKTKEKISLKHHLSNMEKFFEKMFFKKNKRNENDKEITSDKEKNSNKEAPDKHQLCPDCQAPIIYENAKFCSKCGATLVQELNEEYSKGRKK